MENEDFSKCWYYSSCQKKCSTACIRYLEMKNLIDSSELPELFRYPKSLEPENVDYNAFCRLADIKDGILEFVKTGSNLYICGEKTGTGKSTWASKLMLKYFDNIWAGNGFTIRGKWVHVPSLLINLKDFSNPVNANGNKLKSILCSCDLVVWDDIASTGLSNYDLSQLLTLIDTRVFNCKANIFTGNITSEEEMEKVLGSRLTSRIWNKSEIITFRGKDRRN